MGWQAGLRDCFGLLVEASGECLGFSVQVVWWVLRQEGCSWASLQQQVKWVCWVRWLLVN